MTVRLMPGTKVQDDSVDGDLAFDGHQDCPSYPHPSPQKHHHFAYQARCEDEDDISDMDLND